METDLHASVGERITTWHVDARTVTLTQIAEVALPAPVQYAWRHPVLPLLYVAFSNRYLQGGDDCHGVAIMRIDPRSGSLSEAGPTLRLLNRPVHLSVDRAGRNLLIAYNDPSEVSVHSLDCAGLVASPERGCVLRSGIYAHQVRVARDDRTVVVSARGNDAAVGRDEDPGSLEIFRLGNGKLEVAGVVAPGGGMGFGPRHVDFHPGGRWIYVSVERQNQLQMFEIDNGKVASRPRFAVSTLAGRKAAHAQQLAGAIHVSGDGRFVFLTNRASGATEVTERPVFAGGENNVAVFAIDPETGEPTPLQHADVSGFHARTLALHPDGSMLVASTLAPLDVLDSMSGSVRTLSPALSVFKIGRDGMLERRQTIEIDTGDQWLFWCGMVRRAI